MSTFIYDYHEPIKKLGFPHGLGDTANLVHSLPLWLWRGYKLEVASQTIEEREPLFRAVGIKDATGSGVMGHPFYHPGPAKDISLTDDWAQNKLAHNLTAGPLPKIGSVEQLWKETLNIRLTLEPQLTKEQRERVDAFVAGMGPYVAVHTRGNTTQWNKNFSPELEQELYRELLDRTDAHILLLDWDNRVSRIDHRRVTHLSAFGHTRLTELWYLLSRASCLVGIDSGPYHLCRMTRTPCVGVWFGHHPAHYALPREQTVNVVDGRHGEWNSKRRHSYNLLEVHKITGEVIADCVSRLRDGWSGGEVAFDSVLSKLRQYGRAGLYLNREPTFRKALSVLTERSGPVLVETGCVRSKDDWTAGFSTYVFGWFCKRAGGELHSVDNDAGHCDFARYWSAPFPVTVHESDSLEWLTRYSGKPIDLFYADSLDADLEGHAEHCLAEVKAALPHLKPDGMILIDDTPCSGNVLKGKGALAVPYLEGLGWRVDPSSGYQVLLRKGG